LATNARRPPRRISPRAAGLAIAVVVLGSLLAGVLYTAFGPGERISVAPNSVAVFNPATNALMADLAVGVHPEGVAVGPDSVWVANTDDHTVSRLDSSTLELVRTIPLPVYPSDLAVGLGGVWVLSGPSGRVMRINPADNGLSKPISLGYTCRRTAEVTIGAGSVWATCDVPPGAFRVDVRTRASRAFLPDSRRGFADAVFGLGKLWLADRVRNEVLEVDPVTNRVVRRIPVRREPVALAVAADAVWVVSSRDGWLSRIATGRALEVARIKVGKEPVAVAAADDAIWVAHADDKSLTRIDPHTGRTAATIKLSNTPVGLELGAGRLWVTIQSQ